MKQTIADKPVTSISAKKSAILKHEMLFTPYKIEWKNTQPLTGMVSSRTFFSNIRNDLNTLKNDVERMINKDGKGDSKCRNSLHFDGPVDQLGSSLDRPSLPPHPNSKSSGNKQSRKKILQENIENMVERRATGKESQSKLKQLPKSIPLHESTGKYLQARTCNTPQIQQNEKKDIRLFSETSSDTFNITSMANLEKKDTNQDDHEDLKAKNNELEAEIGKLKNQNWELSKKLEDISKDRDQLKMESEELRSHNLFLQQKIQDLSEKMSMVTYKYKEKEGHLKQLENKLIHIEQQKQKVQSECKMKLDEQESKFSYRVQQQLKKCQRQFMEQIQSIEQDTKKAVEVLEEENLAFSEKIRGLQSQIPSNQKKEYSSVASKSDFSLLGTEYETKINQLIEENYALKNTITNLQSRTESLNIEKEALLEEIRVLEEYESERTKSASSQELEKLILELDTLKKEKDKLVDDFELQIMKLENELEHERNKKAKSDDGITAGANLNKILKEQLQENQQLKGKLRESYREVSTLQGKVKELEQTVSVLNERLNIQRMNLEIVEKNSTNNDTRNEKNNSEIAIALKNDLEILKKKYESLNSVLETKNKQIKSKDEFIERVLISKLDKKYDEDEIDYILRSINP